MSGNPYESPDNTGGESALRTKPAGGCLLKLLGGVSVLAILIALFLLPNTRRAGEAAWRTQCSNNLKQIGVALCNYEAVHNSLPPAYTVDENGKPLHSWRTLLLPYLEQGALYDRIDLTKPWDHPANKEAYETSIKTYQCPSAKNSPRHTAYLAILGPNSCFQSTQPRKLAEITDDPNSTLAVFEADRKRSVHWMSPFDISEEELLTLQQPRAGPHRGVNLALCVNGRTVQLRSTLDVASLRALISINGNDDVVARDSQ